MNRFIPVLCLLGSSLLAPSISYSQTDDVRTATGMPIPIGQTVIFGHVGLKGITPGEKRPMIFVTLIMGGMQLERAQANDRGYYYFMRSPQNGATLIFEVAGSEVARTVLTESAGSNARRDIELDWRAFKTSSNPQNEVVSAKYFYDRSESNAKLFQRATEAAKQKKTDEAIGFYKQLVEADPKDYIAWTELGSIYFGKSSLADAETAYSKAMELKPDFVLAPLNLGKLYISQKQYDKAIQALTKAIVGDPTSADSFQYLGEAYLLNKTGSKAVVALNEALRLAPEKADIHLRLAALYNAAGLKDRAANEYALYLKKTPNSPDKEKLEKYIKENTKPAQ